MTPRQKVSILLLGSGFTPEQIQTFMEVPDMQQAVYLQDGQKLLEQTIQGKAADWLMKNRGVNLYGVCRAGFQDLNNTDGHDMVTNLFRHEV